MRTMIIACFAGICFLSTLFLNFRQDSIFPPVSHVYAQRMALYERNSQAELNSRISLVNILDAEPPASEEIPPPASAVPVSEQPPHPGSPLAELPEIVTDAEEVEPELIKHARVTSKKLEITKPDVTIEAPQITAARIAAENAEADEANKRALAELINTTQPKEQVEETVPEIAVQQSYTISPAPKPEIIKPEITDKALHPSASHSNNLLYGRIFQLKEYARENNFNRHYAFIADLGVSSGKKRFYVVNLSDNTIVKSGLLAYTKKGDNTASATIYRIEKTGSNYYELYNLDQNGNVVSPQPEILSSLDCIPTAETDTLNCEDAAGPCLSPQFLKEITHFVEESESPLLLWILK